jgi:hypothetical protein
LNERAKENRLLTDHWTADVEALETAIGRFVAGRAPANECRVMLFEVARDADLHVNVTHRHKTKAVDGWAGPGSVAGGFVNNRTFGDTSTGRIAGHIRHMVFAARA